jgi:hypothetical protein
MRKIDPIAIHNKNSKENIYGIDILGICHSRLNFSKIGLRVYVKSRR